MEPSVGGGAYHESQDEIVRVAISRPEKVVKTLVGIRAYLGFYFDKSHENSVTCCRMFGDQNILPTNFEFRPVGALDEDEETPLMLHPYFK
jgi:hypothetical protein